MNKEFVDALNLLAAERNLDREQLLASFEESLEQAFERNVMPGKQIEVILDPETGEIEVLVIRRVVEEVEDADREIELTEALELDGQRRGRHGDGVPCRSRAIHPHRRADDQTGHYPEDPRGRTGHRLRGV